MNSALLVVIAFQLVAMTAYEKKLKQPTAVIWLLLIPFLLIPLVFEVKNGTSGEFYSSTIFDALSFIVAANAIYALSLTILASTFQQNPKDRTISLSPETISTQTLLYCAIILLILALNQVTPARILSSTLTDKRELGLSYLLTLWMFCLLAGSVIRDVYCRNGLNFLISIPVLLIILVYFRSRSLLAVLLVGWLITDYIFRYTPIRKILLLGIFGLAGLAFAILLKAVRYMGSLSNVRNIEDLSWNLRYITSELFSSGDFSIYKYMLFLFDRCNEIQICGNVTILSKLLSKIGLATADVQTIEYTLYDAYFERGVGGSLHPSIYGIAYGDNGWFGGIAFFALLATANFYFSRFCHGKHLYLYLGFIGYYIMFVSRGSFYNAFMTAIFGIILSYIFGFISRNTATIKLTRKK